MMGVGILAFWAAQVLARRWLEAARQRNASVRTHSRHSPADERPESCNVYRVTTCQPGQTTEALAVLAGALAEDPLYLYYFKGRDTRALSRLLKFNVEDAAANELAFIQIDTEDRCSVAGVVLLHHGISRTLYLLAFLLLWPWILLTHPIRWPQMVYMVWVECTVWPAACHLRLDGIGVLPARQSCGIGSALIGKCIELSREVGLPLFLTTANPRNHSFYRRYGFEEVGRATPRFGPEIVAMMRQLD